MSKDVKTGLQFIVDLKHLALGRFVFISKEHR